MKIQNLTGLLRPLLATLLPLAAFILQGMFWPYLQPYVWFLFYPAVFFSAWIDGLRGGLTATVLSAILVTYFFVPPQFSFAVESPRNFLSAGVFATMGVLFGYTQERLKQANRETGAALAAARSANDQLETRVRERTAALQESQAMFQGLFEAAPDPIVVVNSAGQIAHLNNSAEKSFGYRREELSGQPIERLLPERFQERHRAHRAGYVTDPQARAMGAGLELTARRKDGGEFPVDITLGPLKLNGDLLVLSIIRDVTERQRVEGTLQESEKRFRSLFENMLNGFAYCRMLFEQERPADFIYLEVNKAFETLTGLKNVVGKKVSEVIPGIRESDPGLFEIYGRVALTGLPETFETYVEALRMWFSISVYSPQKEYFVAVFDVITERKRAEAALRESEQKFSVLFEEAAFAVSLSRLPDGVIVDVNEAFERTFGYTKQEVIGKTSLELGLNPDPEGRARVLAALKEQGAVHNLELALHAKSGELHVHSVNVDLVDIGDQKYILNSTQDITERKRAEEEIRKLNAELEQRVIERTAQLETANQELEAFSYSVSHDLRAPLRGIDGWSLALLEDYGDRLDQQGRQYLDRVRSETQRMGELIDDMLELSRVSRAEMRQQAVDLSAIAQTIAAGLRATQPERRVEFIIQPGLSAQGDAILLEAVLTNLLSNAFKFTGKTAPARIEFGQAEAQGQHAFFVRDNGAGFDMAYAQKLFGAFQRLHKVSDFPGTGVGLASVQRVIHRHGGRVWAEAGVNTGATFYFTLE